MRGVINEAVLKSGRIPRSELEESNEVYKHGPSSRRRVEVSRGSYSSKYPQISRGGCCLDLQLRWPFGISAVFDDWLLAQPCDSTVRRRPSREAYVGPAI